MSMPGEGGAPGGAPGGGPGGGRGRGPPGVPNGIAPGPAGCVTPMGPPLGLPYCGMGAPAGGLATTALLKSVASVFGLGCECEND